jgi:hypothetical protein
MQRGEPLKMRKSKFTPEERHDNFRIVGKPYLTGLCQGCPFLSGVGFRPNQGLGE